MKNKYKLICLAIILLVAVIFFYRPQKMSSFFKIKSVYIDEINNITILKNYINEKENIPRNKITINDKQDIKKIFKLLSTYKIRRTLKNGGNNYGSTYIIYIRQNNKRCIQIYQTGYDVIVVEDLSKNKLVVYKLINAKKNCDKLINELELLLNKYANNVTMNY